jgi:branched-chain amino acid transport system substrate-binding protein
VSRSGSALAPAILAVILLSLTGCDAAGVPAPTPTPEPTYAVTGDGVLRIGTLFATSGPEAARGPAQVAAVEVAVRELNELGGIGGVPVEVVHRNPGDAAEGAEAAFADLVARGVDVVIGPSTPGLVEALGEAATVAGVAVVSPAASLPELQGRAIAGALSEEGTTEVAYLYLDGEPGEATLTSLTDALEAEDGQVVYSASFKPSAADFASIISNAKKAKPDAVVLVTPAEAAPQTATIIAALDAADLGGSMLWLTSDNLAAYPQLPGEALAGVNGVHDGAQPDAAFVARLRQADPSIANTLYAAEAYDATIMAALAVTVVGDDGGPAIARTLASVSGGGIPCTSYGACLDVLETETDIDYDGVSGPLGYTESGRLASGAFGLFTYSDASTYALRDVLVASWRKLPPVTGS